MSDQVDLKEYVDYLEDTLADIADEFRMHVTQGDTIPSGPDTSKFQASRGGMVEVAKNVSTGGGQYSLPRQFILGIKVGGIIDTKIHDAIDGKIKLIWADILEGERESFPEVIQGNGVRTAHGILHYSKATGTNWSIYGFIIS